MCDQIVYLLCYPIASTITFNQSSYNVNESDSTVDITLHHSNPSSINITLIVNTNSVTASGEWLIYYRNSCSIY